MIVVEPEAPQAIHAACVSLPNPCDVKQPGRSPDPVWSVSAPRRKWRLIWAALFPVNTLFCAFCRRSQRTAKPAISSAEPGGLERLAAPLRPVSVSREWRHICACRNSVNTLFCTLCSTRCKSTGTAEFEAQAGLSRVACNPEFPAGPFRRRAASIPRSYFRQQPFCTSMRNKDSKAFSRILRAKRCLTEPIHTGPAMTEAFQMERTI